MFRQTLAQVAELGLPVFELPSWYDVDDEDALRVLIGELIDGKPFRTFGSKPRPPAPRCRYLLRLLETIRPRRAARPRARSSRVA